MSDWFDSISHGGDLKPFVTRFGVEKFQWLDLSTAISPFAWDVRAGLSLVSDACFEGFPDYGDLCVAAKCYYGARHVLPAPGSQALIWLLPLLWSKGSCVTIFSPTYSEHLKSWSRFHKVLLAYSVSDVELFLPDTDVLVITNPNNPTGDFFEPDWLLGVRDDMASRGKTLIVDEAFVDVSPKLSVAKYADVEGLVVIRSLGKFFGAAGLRVGFLLGHSGLLDAASKILGLWTVSGVSAYLATQMLEDVLWQKQAIKSAHVMHRKMRDVFDKYGWEVSGCHGLFFYFCCNDAASRLEHFGLQGIALRYFRETGALRVGLCNNTGFKRFLDGVKSYGHIG